LQNKAFEITSRVWFSGFTTAVARSCLLSLTREHSTECAAVRRIAPSSKPCRVKPLADRFIALKGVFVGSCLSLRGDPGSELFVFLNSLFCFLSCMYVPHTTTQSSDVGADGNALGASYATPERVLFPTDD